MTRQLTADHLLKVPLDQRKMSKVVERAPGVARVVVACREWATQLLLGRAVEGRQKLRTAFIELGLNFNSLHALPSQRPRLSTTLDLAPRRISLPSKRFVLVTEWPGRAKGRCHSRRRVRRCGPTPRHSTKES